MIPSIPQIPSRLGCRKSPGRFYTGHHTQLTRRSLVGFEEGGGSTQEYY